MGSGDSPVASTSTDTAKHDKPEATASLEDELKALRDAEAHTKQELAESVRKERLLIHRLAVKEQQMQDYVIQIQVLKESLIPTPAQLRNTLVDPAVNIFIQKLKAELQSTKTRLDDTKKELEALKFTPDSTTGKRLMAKCRQLYQENEELGRMTSNGRLAKLENDLAVQKNYSELVKKSQMELENDLQMLDEDVEGMQTTIIMLQHELRLAKDKISTLENENQQLKQQLQPNTDVGSNNGTDSVSPTDGEKTTSNGNDVKIEKVDNEVDVSEHCENNGDYKNRTSNENKNSANLSNGEELTGDDGSSEVATNNKRKNDSTLDDSDGVESNNQIIVINHKKLRRSSPIQRTITSEPTNGK